MGGSELFNIIVMSFLIVFVTELQNKKEQRYNNTKGNR